MRLEPVEAVLLGLQLMAVAQLTEHLLLLRRSSSRIAESFATISAAMSLMYSPWYPPFGGGSPWAAFMMDSPKRSICTPRSLM